MDSGHPDSRVEATTGIEPVMEVLQLSDGRLVTAACVRFHLLAYLYDAY
jgi:hypothetical protein